MPKFSTRVLVSLLTLIVALAIAACGGTTPTAQAPKATEAPKAVPTTAPAPKATDAPKPAAANTTAPTAPAAPKATDAPKVVAPTTAPTAAAKAAPTNPPAAAKLTGEIKIDGSSTVFPISEAMAEEFQKKNNGVRVTVGVSGTGGGFQKFCNGETDISNASRPINATETTNCGGKNIEAVEFRVAFDGLSVVVNKANDWAKCLTVSELNKIWMPDSKINNWKDIRAGFPDMPLKLFGAGTDSGTFEYFTEAVNKKAKASRSDYQASEDDNVLVQGVSGERGGMGYFGFGYYEENKDKLGLVAVTAGEDPAQGCVLPSQQSIEGGTYKPLSRPLFVYAKKASMARPEVRAFLEFNLKEGLPLIPQVGYVRLPQAEYDAGLKKLADTK